MGSPYDFAGQSSRSRARVTSPSLASSYSTMGSQREYSDRLLKALQSSADYPASTAHLAPKPGINPRFGPGRSLAAGRQEGR